MHKMHSYTVIIIVNALLVFSLGIARAQDSTQEFRGAVVEYGAKYVNVSSKATVLTNVLSYGEIVAKLKENYPDLKVIVFPEGGLSSSEWLLQGNISLIHGENIPAKNETVSFCETSYQDEVLKRLACIAKNNSVYLQVNLVEKSKKANGTDILYNTNVVFSPTGSLVAKYRKYNLLGTDNKIFTKPEKAETVFFDTDFGVRFGTFTGFDIIFKSPAHDLVNGDGKVSHVLHGSAWESQLPYFTAIQEQSSWAYGTNKVLLSAGLNNPQKYGHTGSGIYLGQLKGDDSFIWRSAQSQIKGDFAIVSYIPKFLNTSTFSSRSETFPFYNTSKPEISLLKVNNERWDVYTTETFTESDKVEPEDDSDNVTLITKTSVHKTVCNRNFCCDFKFNVTKEYCLELIMPSKSFAVGEEFGQFNYRLAVFNGVKNFNGATTGLQVCSIISCLDNSEGSCGKRSDSSYTPKFISPILNYKFVQCYTKFDDVIITANITTENSFVSPNILLSSNYYESSPHHENDNFIRFGQNAYPSFYTLEKNGDTVNKTTPFVFKSTDSIPDPASIGILNRLYDLDGKPETVNPSSGTILKLSTVLYLIPFVLLFLKR